MTRTHGMRLTLAALLVGIVAIAVALSTSQRAKATTAWDSAYTIMYIREDRFRNWDFHCNTSLDCVRRTNVDWPMSLLFYNNAEIEKVKNILAGRYDQGGSCASAQHGRLDDGAGMHWDSDRGRKTTCCPGAPFQPSTAGHIRFYSAGYWSHDRMYNTSWGYWIIASNHMDHNEPFCTDSPDWYGFGEAEEHNAASYWRNSLGRPVWEDQQSWYNYQYADQGHYYIRNNGYASVFWVS